MTKINDINLPIVLELKLSPESLDLIANLQSLASEPVLTRRLSTDPSAKPLSTLITAEQFELALSHYTSVWNNINQQTVNQGTLPSPGARSRPAMAAALRSLGIEVAEPADG